MSKKLIVYFYRQEIDVSNLKTFLRIFIKNNTNRYQFILLPWDKTYCPKIFVIFFFLFQNDQYKSTKSLEIPS